MSVDSDSVKDKMRREKVQPKKLIKLISNNRIT